MRKPSVNIGTIFYHPYHKMVCRVLGNPHVRKDKRVYWHTNMYDGTFCYTCEDTILKGIRTMDCANCLFYEVCQSKPKDCEEWNKFELNKIVDLKNNKTTMSMGEIMAKEVMRRND